MLSRKRKEHREPIEQPNDPDIRYIALTQGQVAVVDNEDYERLNKHSWSASPARNSTSIVPIFYAVRTTWIPDPNNPLRQKMGTLMMHRSVLNYFGSLEVDHIFGKTLDNRKSQLRIATHVQNSWNTGLQKNNSTGYRGVYVTRDGRYSARITFNGVEYYLGVFNTAEEASAAYETKARELRGEYHRAA
jgi:hypothetical protein